jgi:hypothetical protein
MAGRRTPEQIVEDAWYWHREALKVYNTELCKKGTTAPITERMAVITALAETARTALYAEEIRHTRKQDDR